MFTRCTRFAALLLTCRAACVDRPCAGAAHRGPCARELSPPAHAAPGRALARVGGASRPSPSRPALRRDCPLRTTCSPSRSPAVITETFPCVRSTLTLRCCAVLALSTTYTYVPCCPVTTASLGTTSAFFSSKRCSVVETNCPAHSDLVGVREGRLEHHRSGERVDRVVDEVERAARRRELRDEIHRRRDPRPTPDPAMRRRRLPGGPPAVSCALWRAPPGTAVTGSCPEPPYFWMSGRSVDGHGKAHEDRADLIDHDERRRSARVHDVSLAHEQPARAPRDRRANLRVVEIELRVLDRGLIGLHGGGEAPAVARCWSACSCVT